MMNRNYEFIRSVSTDDIPWNRLVTAYGRATDFPSYLHALQGSDIPDGENDNTVLLLFNMMDGIENQKPKHNYQIIT